MSLMCKKCVGCQLKEGLCSHEWTILVSVLLIAIGLASVFIFHVL